MKEILGALFVLVIVILTLPVVLVLHLLGFLQKR